LLAVAARPPDVVLLDLGLPGTDGFELAAGLRARDGMKDAVFIAITGHTLPKYRERARECRFTDVLIKPYEPEFLRGLLADQQAMRTREQLEAGEPRGRVTATAGRSG
jgi:CheY-like chemotaxis protein